MKSRIRKEKSTDFVIDEPKISQNPAEKLKLFALASNGKSHSFNILVTSDLNLIEVSHALLSKYGFTTEELKNLILSPTKLNVPPPSTEVASGMATVTMAALDSSSYPPVPKPENKDDFPPQKSSEMLVSTHDIAPFIYFWGDKGESQGNYVPAVSNEYFTTPPFPVPSKILYKRYWLNTGSYKLVGPQHFSKALTTKQGMSQTESSTMSAEIGVELKGLSAKLSETLTTSITITEERSVTETYDFEVKAGTTVVYTLWQLIEEFALVDSANYPIEWQGKWGPKSLFIFSGFPAKFKENVFTNNSQRYVSDPVIFE
jgi:hypothetical protein